MESFDFLNFETNTDESYYEEDENNQIYDNVLGAINKNDLNYDDYYFTIYDIVKDMNGFEVSRKESNIRILVFPFDIEEDVYNKKSSVAAVAIENGDFFCAARSSIGKKTFLLKTNKYDFVINGRWMRNSFVSLVNNMVDMAENREIRCQKDEHRGEKNLHIIENGSDFYIIPIYEENMNGHVPVIIGIKENTEDGKLTRAAVAENVFVYKNTKFFCRWEDETFVCYKVEDA